jgi:hypothetical protein
MQDFIAIMKCYQVHEIVLNPLQTFFHLLFGIMIANIGAGSIGFMIMTLWNSSFWYYIS